MDAVTLLAGLILAFSLLIMLTKKEQDLKEDPAKVQKLLEDTSNALAKASEFVDKEKIPHGVIDELDGSLCKLMCNVREDKEEATQISVLYGHFKHVLDEFMLVSPPSDKYAELKKHIENQYGHIHHELLEVAQRRGVQLAGGHSSLH